MKKVLIGILVFVLLFVLCLLADKHLPKAEGKSVHDQVIEGRTYYYGFLLNYSSYTLRIELSKEGEEGTEVLGLAPYIPKYNIHDGSVVNTPNVQEESALIVFIPTGTYQVKIRASDSEGNIVGKYRISFSLIKEELDSLEAGPTGKAGWALEIKLEELIKLDCFGDCKDCKGDCQKKQPEKPKKGCSGDCSDCPNKEKEK